MKLQDLKKQIPYKWRVQSCSKKKAVASCVAYIDARDAMDLLDEVCGPENWQDKYEFVGDKLIAGIGIQTINGWVWKYDTGTESDTESEKGQFSDAFKRAGVKWGIGRFLYELDIQQAVTNGPKSDQNKYPYVIDENGKRVWDLTTHINGRNKTEKKPLERATLKDNPLCPLHSIVMFPKEASGKKWYSHKTLDGGWCNGK